MQRTIQRRSANNLSTPIGTHWTITSIVRNPDNGKVFGFGLSDDGATLCFLPRGIVLRHNMTEHDVGAGFTAPIKVYTGYRDEAAADQVIEPLTWDGAAEEITLDDVAPEGPTDEELDTLVSRLGSLADLHVVIDGVTEVVRGAQNDLSDLKDNLRAFASQGTIARIDTRIKALDACSERLVGMHNMMTEQEEWLDEEYPG